MTMHDAMLRALEAAEEYRLVKKFHVKHPGASKEELFEVLAVGRLLGIVRSTVDSRYASLVAERRWPDWWKWKEVSVEEMESAIRFEVQLAKLELFAELAEAERG